MICAPPPANEAQRLAALYQYQMLDTPPEPSFDELTELAAAICQAPIALITLVDEQRQWFKSRVGLDEFETERHIAFCAHTILQSELLVVEDAAHDTRFADNPLVEQDPRIRFYAGAPLITAQGHALGTLCVIDRKPRKLSRDQERALRVLSKHVMTLLELRKRNLETEALRTANERLGNQLRQEQLRREQRNISGDTALNLTADQPDQSLASSERSRLALLSMLEDQQRAENALRRSENRFRTLAMGAPVGIYRRNAAGICVYVNPRWCAMTGMAEHDLLRDGWEKAVHVEDRGRVLDTWHQAGATHQPFEAEYRLVRAPAREAWVLDRASVEFDPGGEVVGYLGTVADITHRKQMEAALRQLNEQLEERVQERTAELAAANDEMEAFTYAVSHDLRAPLRAIQGFERALMEDYGNQLPDGAHEFLDEIRIGGQRMGELIEGLLELSRGTQGRLERQPVALDRLARELHTQFDPASARRRIELHTAGDLNVAGDPRLLRTLLQNLLENAWKYTAPVAHAVIDVTARTVDGEQVICVADNGVGFDERFAGKLFEPFQRLHHQDEFRGIGIGLATVARIVRRHGGWIRGTGSPGRGAQFCFTLTRRRGEKK